MSLDPQQQEKENPQEQKPQDVGLLGLPRLTVYAAAFGAAGGYIITGVIGLLGFPMPNPTVLVLVSAALAGIVANIIQKRKKTK